MFIMTDALPCMLYNTMTTRLILLYQVEFCNNFLGKTEYTTVKPVHTVTCVKRSPFSCPVIENFIWIEPILRGHLSYKATFSFFQRWPFNTGFTVLWPSILLSDNVDFEFWEYMLSFCQLFLPINKLKNAQIAFCLKFSSYYCEVNFFNMSGDILK